MCDCCCCCNCRRERLTYDGWDFENDRFKKMQLLQIESRWVEKFYFWPRRDPQTGKFRLGHVWLYQMTYIAWSRVTRFNFTPRCGIAWKTVSISNKRIT